MDSILFFLDRINRIDKIFFAFGEESFRPKDRGKMEDRSAMTRDDRPNDPHSLKRHPWLVWRRLPPCWIKFWDNTASTLPSNCLTLLS